MTERQVLEAPLLLLRVSAVPDELDHLRAGRARDLLRAVVALRVDDEDFVEPRNRREALREVRLLVLRHHDDRDRNGRSGNRHALLGTADRAASPDHRFCASTSSEE